MSDDDLVKQSIAELQDLVRCRCHPAYKDRGLHDPDCECDSADAVQVVADHIEELVNGLRRIAGTDGFSFKDCEIQRKIARAVLAKYRDRIND